MDGYKTIKDAALQWGLSERRVVVLCEQGRIEGAKRFGWSWAIPNSASKPKDARKKKIESDNSDWPQCKRDIVIRRIWAMPNSHTFEIKPIRELILSELTDGVWIDPFANRNKFATITNDLSPEFDTTYHMDALDFMKMFDDSSIDGILYDPPYSPRQVSECYNDVGYNVTWDTTKASFWGNHKREISRIVKVGGKVITFGWNSGGIGQKYGFEITQILLVPHGGWHNDTLCTVEIKTHDVPACVYAPKPISRKKGNTVDKMNNQDRKLISIMEALPSDYWDFTDVDTKELTHGFHNYPAVMVYPISRNIFRIMKSIMNVESVLDPFAGSGTVLVEGVVAGIRDIYGTDLNPLARLLTTTKTKWLEPIALTEKMSGFEDNLSKVYEKNSKVLSEVDDYIITQCGLDITSKDGWGVKAPEYLRQYLQLNSIALDIPNFKNLGYWFRPRAILELCLIRQCIDAISDSDYRAFALVAFSETVRLVSNRRNGEFKMFRMPKDKIDRYRPDAKRQMLDIVKRNIAKMSSYYGVVQSLSDKPTVHMCSEDATVLANVPDNSIDLMVTSPPYGDSRTTVAYGEYSRLSIMWTGIDDANIDEITKIDKKLMGGTKYRNGFEYTINSPTLQKSLETIKDVDLERAGDVYSFYHDLDSCIKTTARKMKKGGYQFWVVGNRTVKMETLQTDIIIQEIAQTYGLVPVYSVDRNIPNKVMPSLNSPSNETGIKVTTMTNEHIVILRKE